MANETFYGGNIKDYLPFSLEAEQSVLGSILVDAKCMDTVLEYISSPEAFYKEVHKKLFSAMSYMYASQKPIDFVTVLEEAGKENIFEELSL